MSGPLRVSALVALAFLLVEPVVGSWVRVKADAIARASTPASFASVHGVAHADTVSPAQDIVFVGSSTIARWNVAASFPDLQILNRGVAGSHLADAIRDTNESVLPFNPRLVVVYAGENDIAASVGPEEVALLFHGLADAVHAKRPSTGIVFVGLKPSMQRWHLVQQMREANAMIRAICDSDDRLTFVDVEPAMLDADGYPRRRLFHRDGLHLSTYGYRVWAQLLRPHLAPRGDVHSSEFNVEK